MSRLSALVLDRQNSFIANVQSTKVKFDEKSVISPVFIVTEFMNIFSIKNDAVAINSKIVDPNRSLIEFELPVSCSPLQKYGFRREYDQYSVNDDGNVFAYFKIMSTYTKFLIFGGASNTISDTPRFLQENNQVWREAAQRAAADACASIIKDAPLQSIVDLAAKLDRLLDKRDSESTLSISSTIHPSQDNNIIYLLILNKFGPLVIVFFFSSILITLYKYSARLVSFYYGRYFAIEAIDGPVSSDVYKQVARTFSPDTLDFGRMPKTPIEMASDIASKVVEKIDLAKIAK